MNASDAVATGALLVMGAIALVLLVQYLKLRDIGKVMSDCKAAVRWARAWEVENRELRAALRAERAHVEQLRRKVVLLEGLLPVL